MKTEPDRDLSRAQIQQYLNQPYRRDPDLRARVDRMLRASIGVRFLCNEWFAPENSDRWEFALNEKDENVPTDPAETSFDASVARWTCRIVLSHRGPLVTCETLSLVPERPDPWHDSQWRYDRPPRPKAVSWVKQIAREFALHYVDAKMLRDWEVSYDEIDPEFDLEHDVLAVPNAFQVLFYE